MMHENPYSLLVLNKTAQVEHLHFILYINFDDQNAHVSGIGLLPPPLDLDIVTDSVIFTREIFLEISIRWRGCQSLQLSPPGA